MSKQILHSFSVIGCAIYFENQIQNCSRSSRTHNECEYTVPYRSCIYACIAHI